MTQMMHSPLAVSLLLLVLVVFFIVFYIAVRVASSRAEAGQREAPKTSTSAPRKPESSD